MSNEWQGLAEKLEQTRVKYAKVIPAGTVAAKLITQLQMRYDSGERSEELRKAIEIITK